MPAACAIPTPGERVRIRVGARAGTAATVLCILETGEVGISLQGTDEVYRLPISSLEPLGGAAGAGGGFG